MSFKILRNFYGSVLGRDISHALYSRMVGLWDFLEADNSGDRVLLHIGYGFPYLDFFNSCERALAAIPVGLGVGSDLDFGDNNVHCLVDDELPFGDMLFDNVVMVHGLEFSGNAVDLLCEVHRVLNGGGRLMLVVPRRFVFGSLPFIGRRFGVREVESLVVACGFRVLGCRYGLGGFFGWLFGRVILLDCVRVLDNNLKKKRVRRSRNIIISPC